jgi:hypothetical protein
MKKHMPLIAISILAIASIAAISVLDSSTPLAIAGVEKQSTGISMVGHLELVAQNAQGNIKSYVQTDNAIVSEGTGCIIQVLFDSGVSGTSCGGTPGLFDSVVIGTGAPATAEGETEDFSTFTIATSGGLSAGLEDTDVETNDNTGSLGSHNATVSVQFTNTGVQQSITEALLMNHTTGGGTTQSLAYQNFTGIPLDTNDSLTIDWTVTVDNG